MTRSRIANRLDRAGYTMSPARGPAPEGSREKADATFYDCPP